VILTGSTKSGGVGGLLGMEMMMMKVSAAVVVLLLTFAPLDQCLEDF